MAADWIGTGLLGLGAIIFVIAGLGQFRLPNAYARLSAVTVAGSTGLICVILAALFFHPSWANVVKAVLAIIFQLLTSSVGASMMARALYLRGASLEDTDESGTDDSGDRDGGDRD